MRKFLVALAVPLLASCSFARIGYDNADTAVRFWASHYIDLDSAQSDDLRPRIASFHRWHRSNEMPAYATLLHSASQRAERGITTEDVAWAISNIRARIRRLGAKAAEDAAPVLATLAPAQIASLEHKFAEDNEKYAKDFLSADDAKRRKAQLKRALGHFRDFTGDLAPDQEARIEQFVVTHERHVVLRYEDRLRWQHEFVALLREQHTPKELGARLADLFTKPELHRSEEFIREDRRWDEGLGQLIVDLDRTLSARQRASVVKRLQKYATDAEVLAAEKAQGA